MKSIVFSKKDNFLTSFPVNPLPLHVIKKEPKIWLFLLVKMANHFGKYLL